MAKNERTSNPVASKASRVLGDPSAGRQAKSVAGSALSQAASDRSTSSRVAKVAARELENGRSSRTTRSIAGSVLTQKNRTS